MLGCAHTFHLACIVDHLVQSSIFPMCRVIVDLTTYCVLEIGDIYSRTMTMDPSIRATVNFTTCTDLERELAKVVTIWRTFHGIFLSH